MMKWLFTVSRLVSDDGKVYRVDGKTGKLVECRQSLNSRGYLGVSRYNARRGRCTTYPVHRLVAMAFLPNPDNLPTVDHIDRDRTNNHVSNLRWADYKTQAENSSNVLDRLPLPVRVSEDKKQYFRYYHQLPEIKAAYHAKYLAHKDEVKAAQHARHLAHKAMGHIRHLCPDGKRRYHLPGQCPAQPTAAAIEAASVE